MITITTTDKSVNIQTDDLNITVVKTKVKGQLPFPAGTRLMTELGDVNIEFGNVEADGETFDSAQELQDWVEANCFKSGGGDGEGVAWDDVDGKPEYIAAGDSAAQARNAIGLGSAATQPSGAFATSAQGAKADSAVQTEALNAAIATKIGSVQEEGKGWPVKNFLPITQDDYDGLAVKDPETSYEIVSQYPSA